MAYLFLGDQDAYLQVKERVYEYMNKNPYICLKYICQGFSEECTILAERMAYGITKETEDMRYEPCPTKYWFDGATDIQLAANTFDRPIACYSSNPASPLQAHEAAVYLPYAAPKQPLQPFAMHFLNSNH